MIAFLHTSDVHIEKFEKLVRKYDKEITIKHYVNKELLDSALLNGTTDTISFCKEIEAIREDNPSLLICTCSTYGEESDNCEDVNRIDRPIVEYLVSNYSKIGLAYSANSTKVVSENLIYRVAADQDKKIEILNCDCSEYWIHFEQGNFVEYYKSIAREITLIESSVEVIFLAQASMEGAKKYLAEIEERVLSSPEFGVKELLK